MVVRAYEMRTEQPVHVGCRQGARAAVVNVGKGEMAEGQRQEKR